MVKFKTISSQRILLINLSAICKCTGILPRLSSAPFSEQTIFHVQKPITHTQSPVVALSGLALRRDIWCRYMHCADAYNIHVYVCAGYILAFIQIKNVNHDMQSCTHGSELVLLELDPLATCGDFFSVMRIPHEMDHRHQPAFIGFNVHILSRYVTGSFLCIRVTCT